MTEPTPGTTFSIADLVGARIVDADGNGIGRVVDVETTGGRPMRVTGVVVGGLGWLHRLRVAAPLGRRVPEVRKVDVVPWEDVAAWDRARIVLRPQAEAEPRSKELIPES